MAEVNREEVETRLARLRDTHDVQVREEREEVPADLFPDLRDLAAEGYTGGGYVWVVREPATAMHAAADPLDAVEDRVRVLLVLGRGTTRWGLPGGGRECGESYAEAAVREVREETGIECSVDAPFLARKRVTVSLGDHDERLHTLWVYFDGSYGGGTIQVQPGDLNGAAWFAEPPARMHPEAEFRAADWRY